MTRAPPRRTWLAVLLGVALLVAFFVVGTVRRFLNVSYPNAGDRRRDHEARHHREVPEGTGIGGAIGVHSESDHLVVHALRNSAD